MCKVISELFTGWKPPYPEEKFDPDATVENKFADDAIFRWYHDYNVPYRFREYWGLQVIIEIAASFQYPAGVWEEGGKRHMVVQPGYLNSGVIAHEQAHNSYALLTLDWKAWFAQAYIRVQDTEQIKKLWKYRSYGTINYTELYAELYRYLGEFMPDSLKRYYPKLF